VAKAPEPAPVVPPAPPRPTQTPAETPSAVTQAPPSSEALPQVAAVPPAPPARPLPDIRSLGRGSGGAGGSGGGRAGIEGEPIPLDSTDPRYSDYLDQVRRRIKAKWGYPCEKNLETRECEYKTTDLMVEFGIAKDGDLIFVTVLRSSGHPIYDDYAVNAIKLAGFPPIPDSFSKTGRAIVAQFNYVVQSSLTNILR
jgi:TonB family protein